MNGEPVEIDSELELKIAEIFNSQYEYIFSVDEGDYIKRLDDSFNEVKAALIALLMPYIFSGAKYAAVEMGLPWMRQKELAQAIPPVYTKYIGDFLMRVCISNRLNNE